MVRVRGGSAGWLAATVLVWIALSLAGCRIGAAGLFLGRAELGAAIDGIERGAAPWKRAYAQQRSRADDALTREIDPFVMRDMSDISFHWCSSDKDGVDNSLADATRHFEKQGHFMRTLALQYALTGKQRYADGALAFLKGWAARHTPVNMYDFGIDFSRGRIDGMTSGYCSERPWNFALDAMWQTYGLINAADAYLLLTQNGYPISDADDRLIRGWLLDVAEAVNSSFHAWTRWADAHGSSSAYERYRADNHLSWCLAGLLAAAVALGDGELADYVLHGGVWKDRRGGNYANPSSIRDVIDRAIEGNGRVYEEKIQREPPVGYALFHLWPMTLVAHMAELHYGEDLWSYRGPDGGGLKQAYKRYGEVVLGKRSSPKPGEETGYDTYTWLWRYADRHWPSSDGDRVLELSPNDKFIKQSLGPVHLVLGDGVIPTD